MPQNKRQSLIQTLESINSHFEWILYHTNILKTEYEQGMIEYVSDYTEHVAALVCLANATNELWEAYKKFRETKV